MKIITLGADGAVHVSEGVRGWTYANASEAAKCQGEWAAAELAAAPAVAAALASPAVVAFMAARVTKV